MPLCGISIAASPRSKVITSSLISALCLSSSRAFAFCSPAPFCSLSGKLNTCLADSSLAMSAPHDDPYMWLEEVESEESLNFAKTANADCLEALGNPEKDDKKTGTYQRILQVLESNDRIPHVTQFGLTEDGKDALLFNFWKDSSNPKGIWRKTSLSSYRNAEDVQWTTVLDLDALAAKDGISWVWKGSSPLPRSRDTPTPDRVTRALLSLSRGGSDATFIKEFDLTTNQFVADMQESSQSEPAFEIPEAKTRASYKSRNVLLVGTDFGPGSLTNSGYPRTVREWVRGTSLEEAPVVFEGETTDVSVSAYISDERTWVCQFFAHVLCHNSSACY